VSGFSELTESNADVSVIYVKCLSEIPYWEDRLKCWRTSLEFEDKVKDVNLNVSTYLDTLTYIMGLDSIKYVFAIILFCGNEMNKGSARGNAVGFRIDSLLKLSSTRSTSSKGNLLDFVVRQLRDVVPEALTFAADIRSATKRLDKLSLEMTGKNLNELSVEVRRNAETSRKLGPTLSKDDPFHQVIRFFENGRHLFQFDSLIPFQRRRK
jgi:hypothetical protein